LEIWYIIYLPQVEKNLGVRLIEKIKNTKKGERI